MTNQSSLDTLRERVGRMTPGKLEAMPRDDPFFGDSNIVREDGLAVGVAVQNGDISAKEAEANAIGFVDAHNLLRFITSPGAEEEMARLIAPRSWEVFDGYLAEMLRKHKGENIGYDPDAFKDKQSMALARACLDLLASKALGG